MGAAAVASGGVRRAWRVRRIGARARGHPAGGQSGREQVQGGDLSTCEPPACPPDFESCRHKCLNTGAILELCFPGRRRGWRALPQDHRGRKAWSSGAGLAVVLTSSLCLRIHILESHGLLRPPHPWYWGTQNRHSASCRYTTCFNVTLEDPEASTCVRAGTG